ncbi:TonB-dependent receptor domain-containing protein [Sphingobacterium alkalisoli]|uniref:TonB-dependent receptor domain-containing protein n=1 Tax=Sphingobacterium alkalisoli TaxID=1874115 RepID=UPI0010ABADB0|nr:TonB-dependent receptor [Sphingobacterium alkalisoli]
MLYSFLIGLLTVLAPSAYAQGTEHVVSGTVVDEDSLPLSAVTVTLQDVDQQTVFRTATDSVGQFSLRYGIPGRYRLIVNYIGYRDYQSPPFELARIHLDTISLSTAENRLEAVDVKGKAKVLEINGGTISYNVENTIGGQDVSALEALKRAPGVHVENESRITLNGKSGVQILLDGRQTFLSGAELTDLLKSLSSNNIKSIDIINSPSAKYDATGSAGIINIRTKKNQVVGTNGTVTTAVAYGVSPKQIQNIILNHRVNNINVYGSYSHTLGNYNYLYGTNRTQNGKSYDSHTDDVDKRQKMSTQIGVDYFLNAKNTIGFLANGNFIFGGGITDTRTAIRTLPSNAIEESLDAINDYYGQRTGRYNFNVNYKFEDTLGHVLNIDADYGIFDKWNKNLQSNTYRDNQDVLTSQNLYRTLNGIAISLKGVKLDYSMDLWKGKFESGLKYSQVGSVNDSRFYHVDKGQDSLDNRRSNDFQFDERISSAYVDYKQQIDKFSFNAGLRMEISDSKGRLTYQESSSAVDDDINRNYTNLFPFFSITLQPTENQNLSLSYGKRIERPAYQDLNPFIYMLDELSFWQGNPFLNPELTHRLTLLYSLKSSTVVSFNFAYTDQFNARVTDTLERDKIVMISRNVGTQKHSSLALTQHLTPAPWWDVTFNGLLYYIQNSVSLDQYRNFDLQQLAGRASVLQSFRLPLKLKAEVFASYNSNRLSGANTFSRAVSQVDLALQKTLMKEKATLRLAVTDIYKGNQSRSTQSFPGFESSSYGYYESRQVRLSFSYKFNRGASKAQRTRNSALESESGRIK